MINNFNPSGKYIWLRAAETESACQLTPSIVAVKRADESADPVLVSDADFMHEDPMNIKFPNNKANNNTLLFFMILILSGD
jgi:hypothetical protein